MSTSTVNSIISGPIKRDAIIFIPGMGGEWSDQSIEATTRRIATAIDRNTESAGAKLTVEVRFEDCGLDQETKVCTVHRQESKNSPAAPVLDIYELDYRKSFVKRFADRNVMTRALLVLVAIVRKLPRLIAALAPIKEAKRKSLPAKLETLYVIGVFALMIAYLVILIIAIVQLAVAALPAAKSPPAATSVASQTPQPAAGRPEANSGAAAKSKAEGMGVQYLWGKTRRLVSWLMGHAQTVIVILTAIGILSPGRLKGFVDSAAVEYLCLINYLDFGERREVIIGELDLLLEHIVETRDDPQGKIHVMAYSFGSIIALDAIFPVGHPPARRYENIDTLVTIGCPFDLISVYWPRYFTNRQALRERPKGWINVYTPDDILSSNFRDDKEDGKAKETVKLKASYTEANITAPLPSNICYSVGTNQEDLSILDVLTFVGLRSHSLYWEKEFEADTGCFAQIITAMYSNQPMLS